MKTQPQAYLQRHARSEATRANSFREWPYYSYFRAPSHKPKTHVADFRAKGAERRQAGDASKQANRPTDQPTSQQENSQQAPRPRRLQATHASKPKKPLQRGAAKRKSDGALDDAFDGTLGSALGDTFDGIFTGTNKTLPPHSRPSCLRR